MNQGCAARRRAAGPLRRRHAASAVAVCFDAPDLELFETRAEPLHPVLARLGPDILAAEFDAAEARRRLRASAAAARSIAEGLLDQTALAGVGNIWKNESLFAE